MAFSLLDQLTEPEGASRAKLHPDSLEYIRSLKASLCQDLNALLNTRRAEEDFDSSFDQATNSLLTFGIADFTSLNLTSGIDQERVRYSVERAIRQFEPRLTRVSVSLDEPNTANPVLRLHIEAILRIESRREAVSFSAALSRDSRRIAVSGAD
ncbi:MAG: type VI secretion system baseplate subunit TssE [Bryobacteraceae bacterium]